MGNLAYEMLGRVTWIRIKRKTKNYLTTPERRRNRKIAGFTILVIGAVGTSVALSRKVGQTPIQ
jgi:hypothetical protein